MLTLPKFVALNASGHRVAGSPLFVEGSADLDAVRETPGLRVRHASSCDLTPTEYREVLQRAKALGRSGELGAGVFADDASLAPRLHARLAGEFGVDTTGDAAVASAYLDGVPSEAPRRPSAVSILRLCVEHLGLAAVPRRSPEGFAFVRLRLRPSEYERLVDLAQRRGLYLDSAEWGEEPDTSVDPDAPWPGVVTFNLSASSETRFAVSITGDRLDPEIAWA